jgi:hypothetical protein
MLRCAVVLERCRRAASKAWVEQKVPDPAPFRSARLRAADKLRACVTRRNGIERGAGLCISYYKFEIRGPDALRYIGFNKTSNPKGESMKFPRVVAMLLGGVAIGASTAAMAGVSVGVNIGIPAPVYVAPQPVYAPPPPPPVVYQPAPVYAAPPAIVIGWHGDRYWDGRRYWGRDDWYRHHGGYGPGRGWDHGGPPPGHWH